MTRFKSTAALLLLLTGCTTTPLDAPAERVGEARAFLTVEEAVTAGCSTSQLEALSLQIIGQGNCIEPGAFSELVPPANVNFGSAVLPFLEEPARDKLLEALNENPGLNMQVNSMLRTVAQQYLLYRWYLGGMCGIGLAATPGSSNHETGLAIDIQQYDAWRTILEAKGFSWLGASDPVHFDYVGPGAVDHRGLDVLAFQQLHNLNNPSDLIDEDGVYGPQTEARLQLAPAEGFDEGPTCGPPPDPNPGEGDLAISAMFSNADAVFDDGPSAGVVDLYEGRSYELDITLTNQGDATLAGVTLALTGDAFLTIEETSVDVGDIAAGESVDTTVTVRAEAYSVETEDTATLSLSADESTASLDVDVYSETRWEWDGARLEGWRASTGGSVELGEGVLMVEAGSSAIGPDVQVAGLQSIEVVGSSTEPVSIVVQTEDGEDVFSLDPFDGSTAVAATVDGVVTSLRFDATAPLSLDAVRLRSTGVAPDSPQDDEGCSCRTAGGPGGDSPFALLALAGVAVATRRRVNSV